MGQLNRTFPYISRTCALESDSKQMSFESRLKGSDRGSDKGSDRGTEPYVRWEVIPVSGTKHSGSQVTTLGIGSRHIKKFRRG